MKKKFNVFYYTVALVLGFIVAPSQVLAEKVYTQAAIDSITEALLELEGSIPKHKEDSSIAELKDYIGRFKLKAGTIRTQSGKDTSNPDLIDKSNLNLIALKNFLKLIADTSYYKNGLDKSIRTHFEGAIQTFKSSEVDTEHPNNSQRIYTVPRSDGSTSYGILSNTIKPDDRDIHVEFFDQKKNAFLAKEISIEETTILPVGKESLNYLGYLRNFQDRPQKTSEAELQILKYLERYLIQAEKEILQKRDKELTKKSISLMGSTTDEVSKNLNPFQSCPNSIPHHKDKVTQCYAPGTVETAEVDLKKYPDVIHRHGQDAEVTIGDMHGNTMKLIYFLIREGIIELNPQKLAKELFKKLSDVYNGPNPLSTESLEFFESTLKSMTVRLDAPHVRLIGDELADRGKNDLLTLLVLEKLHNEGKPPEILFSNHSLGFAKVYEEHMTRGFKGPVMPFLSPTSSLDGMLTTLKEHPKMKDRVLNIVQHAYLPHLKPLSYSVDHSSKTITVYSHAPVGTEAVDKLKGQYGLICEAYQQNVTAFMNCIDKINGRFKENLKDDVFSAISANKKDAIHYAAWNRNYSGLLRPQFLGDGYRISFVHGHDSDEKDINKTPSHVVCLDNILGKDPEETTGEYSVYITPAPKVQK
jgi:hypothetical protein